MKKFIPILSSVVFLFCLQNCLQRDEETIMNGKPLERSSSSLIMHRDSTRSSEEILYPDPPVRDGDNWKLVQENKE